jgi:hypothetical protein
MAQVGRPPKPTEQKRLLGNPGKRALPNQENLILLPAITEIPEPTRELSNDGMALWDRVWSSGSHWISPTFDIEILQLTCEMLDERTDLRRKVAIEGDPKDRRGLRELDKQIISNLSLLGFTPADRSRLGVAEVRAQTKLEKLRAMRDNK